MKPIPEHRRSHAGYLLLLVLVAQVGLGAAYRMTPEASPSPLPTPASADSPILRSAWPLAGAAFTEQRVSHVPSMAERVQLDRNQSEGAGASYESHKAQSYLQHAAVAVRGARLAWAVHLYDVLGVYRL